VRDKLWWALTQEARKAHRVLVQAGVDPDIAFEMLTSIVKEEDVYDLGEQDERQDRQDRRNSD